VGERLEVGNQTIQSFQVVVIRCSSLKHVCKVNHLNLQERRMAVMICLHIRVESCLISFKHNQHTGAMKGENRLRAKPTGYFLQVIHDKLCDGFFSIGREDIEYSVEP